MPATIKRSAQNSNVYGAYGIMSSDNQLTRRNLWLVACNRRNGIDTDAMVWAAEGLMVGYLDTALTVTSH